MTAFEVGYRSRLQRRLSLDVAAFYNDYDKLRSLELQAFFRRDPRQE